MTKRGVGSTVLGLALLAGVAACDENPLADARETGAYIYLNPVNAVVDAGDTTLVIATVMNQYGTPTNASVTAEPCDTKVTAVADPNRSAFESPEKFLVTGQTLGVSCVIVRGGGLVDTAGVRIVPARLDLVGDTLLQSGGSNPLTVRFLSTAGQQVSGFDIGTVSFVADSSRIGVVDEQGVVTGRAPGRMPVVVRLKNTWGVARVDTLFVRVVAGQFSGTVTQGTVGATTATTSGVIFTEGAIAFDNDTQARILSGNNVVLTARDPSSPAGTIRLGLPYGLPAGTYSFEVSNIGPNQVASVGTFTVAADLPAEDAFGPDEGTTSTRVMSTGQVAFGTLTGTDTDDWIQLTVAEAGTYRFTTNWNDGSDVDLLLRNGANTAYTSTAMATGAQPETAAVSLQPGTYWIWMNMYDWAPNGGAPTSYYVTVVRQ